MKASAGRVKLLAPTVTLCDSTTNRVSRQMVMAISPSMWNGCCPGLYCARKAAEMALRVRRAESMRACVAAREVACSRRRPLDNARACWMRMADLTEVVGRSTLATHPTRERSAASDIPVVDERLASCCAMTNVWLANATSSSDAAPLASLAMVTDDTVASDLESPVICCASTSDLSPVRASSNVVLTVPGTTIDDVVSDVPIASVICTAAVTSPDATASSSLVWISGRMVLVSCGRTGERSRTRTSTSNNVAAPCRSTICASSFFRSPGRSPTPNTACVDACDANAPSAVATGGAARESQTSQL
mmetsp:Transcript_36927/g.85853  ORF Transcript_36927/g.85853 Transcript_36927/m.85853 type:complete len:305 (-) Transcript_36927:450-1364(-)